VLRPDELTGYSGGSCTFAVSRADQHDDEGGTVSIAGLFGINQCVGEGGCRANGCGSKACATNAWFISYAHYTECGSHGCNANTGLPKATVGCGKNMSLESNCVAGPFYGTLWECGPTSGQYSSSAWCNPGGSHQLIACGNI
jgi:hypothetical protein